MLRCFLHLWWYYVILSYQHRGCLCLMASYPFACIDACVNIKRMYHDFPQQMCFDWCWCWCWVSVFLKLICFPGHPASFPFFLPSFLDSFEHILWQIVVLPGGEAWRGNIFPKTKWKIIENSKYPGNKVFVKGKLSAGFVPDISEGKWEGLLSMAKYLENKLIFVSSRCIFLLFRCQRVIKKW